MARKIDRITISHFKAFREEVTLNLGGKNILVYGANGSGKSSVFWALHLLFQSSFKKHPDDLEKYFLTYDNLEKRTHESLRHIFSDQDPNAETYIEILVKDEPETYRLNGSGKSWDDADGSIIRDGCVGSEFINYRGLYNFYNATNRHEVNLWEVFDKDFAPLIYRDGKTYTHKIDQLKREVPRKSNEDLSGRSTGKRQRFEEAITALNNEIEGHREEIERNANDILRAFFFQHELNPPQIRLTFLPRLNFERVMNLDRRSDLKINLEVELFDQQTGGMRLHKRPHTFLNEAMLTRFAIAIRIGVLRKRVIASNFQVLVLDDMLISLDMSNRSDLLRLMLNPGGGEDIQFFKPFQKIILTHDLGFYEEAVRQTKHDSENWHYMEIKGRQVPGDSPKIISKKSRLERAKDFFSDHELEACGLELRKEAENVITNFLDRVKSKENPILERGDFKSLEQEINQAQEILRQGYADRFFGLIDSSKELKQHFNHLIAETFNPIDLDGEGLADKKKGEIIGRLIAHRQSLFSIIFDALKGIHEKELKAIRILNEVKKIKSRVLNPSAHNTREPIFKPEIQEAIAIIEEMHERLKTL